MRAYMFCGTQSIKTEENELKQKRTYYNYDALSRARFLLIIVKNNDSINEEFE